MLIPWNAVSTLDRMFDDVMGSAFGTAMTARTFNPTIDIRTSDEDVAFVCDVPGVRQEDLDVTLENHVLTIKGTRRFDHRDDEQVVLGRTYGSFARSYTLPEGLDEDNLSANLADGVLTVRVPKHPTAKARRIPIGGASSPKQLNE